MGHRITAGATTCTIGHECGVAALVVETGEGMHTHLSAYRAGGRRLELLAVMQLLRVVGRDHRDATHLDVRASPQTTAAVQAYLREGRFLAPEAVHQMPAIAKFHRQLTDAGVEITYRPGDTAVPADHVTGFEELVARHRSMLLEREEVGWRLAPEDQDWVREHEATVVFTDGSHAAHTGFGSWAWWVDEDRYDSGTVAAMSSTYTERLAILRALRAIDGPVLVVTDLAGAVGEKPGHGRVVHAGHDRVRRQLRAHLANRPVRVAVVKGHHTCPGNQAADQLAGQTLTTTWARLIDERPHVSARLVELSKSRAAALKDLRAAAQVKWERRREQERAADIKAGRIPAS